MIEIEQFTTWLAIWLGGLALVLWRQRKGSLGVGLVLAYALQLWVIHWLAPAMYALPWYGPPTPVLMAGLRESAYAILGVAIGASVIEPLLRRARVPEEADRHTDRVALADPWLLRCCLAAGVISYIAQPIARPLPTLGALVSVASNLLVVAVAMECWNAVHGPGRSIWRWIALTALLPFVTIVTQGFLSYGFAAMLTVLAFVGCIYRPRWKVVALGVIASYLALSIFVTYMRDRRAIRQVVWADGSYSSRLAEVSRTFSDFEFLDLTNIDHLDRIDDRLNQNTLLGTSVEYLATRPNEFARGETIVDALLSPIPRALWRDKPIVAGSGDLVSRFTGVKFAEGTSVGIGHVMEWYVNFGGLGVFFGSLLFGFVLATIDRIAVNHLQHGDWSRFCLWYLSALSLLQVGGSLVEAIAGAAGGMVIGLLILRLRPEHLPPPVRVALRVVPNRPRGNVVSLPRGRA
jgi:hypothetical protein